MKHTLARVVTTNMVRLRQERGWTQRELAILISKQGMGTWTSNRVAQVESGRQRPDRLGDVSALCATFGVDVVELVQSDEPVSLDDGSEPIPASTIIMALRGYLQPPEIAGLAELDGTSDWDAQRQAARVLNIDAGQFFMLKRAVLGYQSFTEIRDQQAGITPDMSARSVQARRGHATRELVMRMKEAMDRDGIDAIVAGEKARYQDLVARSEAREKQAQIDAYEELTGTVYQEEDQS